jgi:hypothetical protein
MWMYLILGFRPIHNSKVILEIVLDGTKFSKCDGPHGRPNLKDPLQVQDGPITRSRAKKIEEAMQGLVQSTWAEFTNLSSKTPAFKMGLREE